MFQPAIAFLPIANKWEVCYQLSPFSESREVENRPQTADRKKPDKVLNVSKEELFYKA